MAISDFLFPQGNFLDIRANAPTQADYNIDATADLVRNNPFRALGEIYAPALTAVASIPYDTIQGIGRAVDNSNLGIGAYRGIVDDIEIPSGPSLSDIGRAIDAENPLSSALERTYGATLPLAERISNMFSMGQAEASDLGEIANLQSILNPITPEMGANLKYISDPSVEGGRSLVTLANKTTYPQNFAERYGPDVDVNLDPEVNMGATGTVPKLKEGILSQVDSRFPLYDDFTVAEKGDDLEDNAVTVDELGNLKQPSGFKDFLKTMLGFAIPGAGLFTGDRSALEGIKSLNQRLRNTDFARSSSLMDYLDARRYGGRDARDAAAARTMAQARGIQKKIDTGKYRRTTADDVIDRGRSDRPGGGGAKTTSAKSKTSSPTNVGNPFGYR